MITYGRTLGAKWNTAASVYLGFPSWCKIFTTVPVHVSPSTHLTCLTYAQTILNFCRSSRRLSVLFAAHHSCFCTSCIVSAAFTTRTCITYHLVTAFKWLLNNFCYIATYLKSFPTVTFSFFICYTLFLYRLILKC